MHRFLAFARARGRDVSLSGIPKRRIATSISAEPSKPTGDISSVFPSLSGIQSPPLPSRFADLKKRLIQGNEDRVKNSWHRLLADLVREIDVIKALGSKVVPELEFKDMDDIETRTRFRDGLRKRGVGLIRGVVSEREALGWKELVKRYIQTNPSTKGRRPSGLLCCRGLCPCYPPSLRFWVLVRENGQMSEAFALPEWHVLVHNLSLVIISINKNNNKKEWTYKAYINTLFIDDSKSPVM